MVESRSLNGPIHTRISKVCFARGQILYHFLERRDIFASDIKRRQRMTNDSKVKPKRASSFHSSHGRIEQQFSAFLPLQHVLLSKAMRALCTLPWNWSQCDRVFLKFCKDLPKALYLCKYTVVARPYFYYSTVAQRNVLLFYDCSPTAPGTNELLWAEVL